MMLRSETLRGLKRLCSFRESVSLCKGRLKFSSSVKPFQGEEINSTLYVSGSRATTTDGVVSPYLDFSEQFQDVNALEHNVSRRGLDTDVKEIVENWMKWKELESYRAQLVERSSVISKTVRTLKNKQINKEKLEDLKGQGRELRNEIKIVTKNIWDLEETAIIAALNLPNSLDRSTGCSDRLLFSLLRKPVFSFQPKSHVDLGSISGELEFIDNSPSAYYLKKRLSLLELVCSDHFLTALKTQGFLPVSNPDFAKSVIVEGSGMHFMDRHKFNRLSADTANADTSSLHLVGGGSLQAFSAYFTKQIIEKTGSLPVRLATIGHNYTPTTSRHTGLLGCRQSTVVDGFILYEDSAVHRKQLLDEVLVTITQNYVNFGIHLKMVQYSAKKLNAHESAAIGILMFSPHTQQYHEVGRIALCGDYISRRLWTLCRRDSKAASFLSMIHLRACHISPFLALLMENQQREDGNFAIPDCLQSRMDTFQSG